MTRLEQLLLVKSINAVEYFTREIETHVIPELQKQVDAGKRRLKEIEELQLQIAHDAAKATTSTQTATGLSETDARKKYVGLESDLNEISPWGTEA